MATQSSRFEKVYVTGLLILESVFDMNSDKLNARLTLLANFGVVVGLLMLGYELREAQHFAETQAAVQRLDQMQQAHSDMAMSESLGLIRVRARSGGVHTLAADELYRLQRWEFSVILRMRSQYVQYTRGYLDRETAEGIVRTAAQALPYWEELGLEIPDNEFQQAVLRAAGRQ